MAKVIVEKRTFKDRDTGISTDYKYYAIGGKVGTQDYEIPLKSLTGAEKTALEMLAAAEGTVGDVTSRPANKDEKDSFFSNKNDDDSNIDLDD